MSAFGQALSANFQEPSSPDQTSTPTIPDTSQAAPPQTQQLSPLAAAIANSKKQKKPKTPSTSRGGHSPGEECQTFREEIRLMLNSTEREILQGILDVPLRAPDAIPRIMTLERAFRSIAGRNPVPADYAEAGKAKEN